MSAFLCSDRQIATIIVGYMSLTGQPAQLAQEYADLLKRENLRSVNYRYRRRQHFQACDIHQAAPIAPAEGGLRAADLMALTTCLDYQSCERPDYEGSAAQALIQRIQADLAPLARYPKSPLWSI